MSARAVAVPGSMQRDINREPETKNIPQEAAAGQPQAQTESGVKNPPEQEIATLAYALWQERGCPEGSPEQDWLQAEATLTRAGRRS